jgi:hypothetical protein
MAKRARKPAVRGVELVQEVIRAVKEGKPGELENPERQPLAPSELDALVLPGNAPLPPSLRRWLAFDATCFQELFVPIQPGEPPRLAVLDEAELFRRYISDKEEGEASRLFVPLRAGVGVFAMYLGTPDAEGEFPIVDVRTGDMTNRAECQVAYPGFDVFLAWVGYVVEDPERVYGRALREARKRNPFLTDEDLVDLSDR